jgi:hypothetical protein
MKFLIVLQLLPFSGVLRILLSNALNPWASHRTRDQVSHPYIAKQTKIINITVF